MTLAQAKDGQELTVKRLEGGFGLRRRLLGLGIHPDQRISVLQRSILGGPVLIAVQGGQVAIGKGVAQKVEVEPREK